MRPDSRTRKRVADLEQVPADAVLASGSGLDPRITLRNARWQMQRVVAARAAAGNRAASSVATAVPAILGENAFAPLSGLVGEPLVNVLEVNLELDRRLPLPVHDWTAGRAPICFDPSARRITITIQRGSPASPSLRNHPPRGRIHAPAWFDAAAAHRRPGSRGADSRRLGLPEGRQTGRSCCAQRESEPWQSD